MSVVNQNLVRLTSGDQGRVLYATPLAKATFDALESRGQSNYWANLIVREIKRLRCSKFSSDYVYISSARSQGDESFKMNLPGCCVTVHPVSYYGSMDNSYVVTDIQVDSAYEEERRSKKTPQLMKAVKQDRQWRARESKQGNQLDEKSHANGWVLVGINGTGNEADTVASVVADHIDNVKQVGTGRVEEIGYNLFFTPSGGFFKGWRALKAAVKPETSTTNRESAILLADVMKKAARDDGIKVRWITQKNGSAILTQAMRILRDQGVRLGEKHTMFLSSPTSSLNSAYNLGQNLGMTFKGDYYNSNPANIVEQVGSQWGGVGAGLNAYQRVRNENDGFKASDAYGQVSGAIGGTKGLMSTGIATAGVLAFMGTGPAGMIAAIATAAGKASLATAATQVGGAVMAAVPTAKLAVNNSSIAKGYHQNAVGHLKNFVDRKFA
ncbi:hypothetical protein [Parendozoicomonas haliclonae]|uniref:Uncharacterized protein n=1 Tax=Parendozoicomonas haliclonae TaxID=1960125 RepID=A0A1X7ATC4_9GAMM|nr:hypothetical protein [Parendozoicomonas haliclonae]SMA50657.1 hypothetical protein EHSB41UT_04474 [Parendozoicomonas haliclonae]